MMPLPQFPGLTDGRRSFRFEGKIIFYYCVISSLLSTTSLVCSFFGVLESEKEVFTRNWCSLRSSLVLCLLLLALFWTSEVTKCSISTQSISTCKGAPCSSIQISKQFQYVCHNQAYVWFSMGSLPHFMVNASIATAVVFGLSIWYIAVDSSHVLQIIWTQYINYPYFPAPLPSMTKCK